MTRLVEVPTQFDDRSFDQFAGAFAEATKDGERLLFDAHAAEWASPYGLVALLAAGQAAKRSGVAELPLLTAPTQADVLSYWARAGFFREATQLFEIHGRLPRGKPAEESDVLLPVTPVRAAARFSSGRPPFWRPNCNSIRGRRWASLWRFRRRVRIL